MRDSPPLRWHLLVGLCIFAAIATVVLIPPVKGETIGVGQEGKAFSHDALTINVGDSVEFRNDDDTAHSVLSFTPGHEFELKLQRPGESQAITFTKPGRIEVECDIHPKMFLVITVK